MDPFEQAAMRVAEGPDRTALRNPAAPVTPSRRLAAAMVVGALMAADALAFVFAWAVLGLVGLAQPEDFRPVLVIGLAGVVLLSATGLYPGRLAHGRELLRRRASAGVKLMFVAGVTSALFGSGVQVVAALALVILALGVQPILRAATRELLDRGGIWRRRAVIVGRGNLAPLVIEYFRRNRHFGLDCVAAEPAGEAGSPASSGGEVALVVAPYPDDETLADLIRQHPETILLGDLPCLPATAGAAIDPDGEIGLRLRAGVPVSGPPLFDRAIDIAVAIVAILLTGPVMLAAAAAIYVLDPGPVIYRQVREGRSGRPFRIFKLRTMYQNADERLEALLQADPAARSEWASHFKLRNDPRVLPVIGALLRSTSVDELPQFFNVLAGDMRVIGPRPFPFYHLAAMDQGFRSRRSSVTPGVTGLWQISERSAADVERQQRLDEYYLDHRSVWFDLEILFGTMLAVFRRNGAF